MNPKDFTGWSLKQQTQESVITVIDKLFPIITTLLFVTPLLKNMPIISNLYHKNCINWKITKV